MAFAALGVSALIAGLPIVVGGSDRLELHSAALVAAPHDRHAITRPIYLQGIPGIRIDRGVLSLSEKQAGKALTGEAISTLVATGSARLVLDGAAIVIDADAPTTLGTPIETVSPLVGALADLGFEVLSIRRGTLVLNGERGRANVIGEINADITVKRKTSAVAKGTLTIRGQKLSLDAALSLAMEKRSTTPVSSTTTPRQQPFKLHLKGPMLEASFDGRVAASEILALQGQGEIAIRNLRDTAHWVGFSWPAGSGLVDFMVKGPVEWNRTSLAFQRANLQMDGNEAQGTLSVSFAGGRPNISGTLALQTLDLNRVTKSAANERTWSLLDGVMRPGPFALPLVRHLDADLRISATRIKAGGLEFGRSAATLSLKNGKLLADIAEVAFDEARGSGQVMVDTNGAEPRYEVRGKLAGIDLAKLLPDQPGTLPVQGRGDLIADVTAMGDTTPELLRSLSGKVSVAMPAGGRIGVDLKALLAAAHKQPIHGWTATAARGSTAVESMQGRLILNQGVVDTESFSALIGDAMLVASGGGNLRDGQVDVRLSMMGRSGQEQSVSAQSPRPVDSLILRGAWNEPSIRVEQTLAMPPKVPAKSP